MAFDRAIQSLANIEEKLRRAFSLAGPIGARLQPGSVTPVILAHDLTRPGHSTGFGRCWAWCSNVTGGSGAGVTALSVVFATDVLIEQAILTGDLAAAVVVDLYVTTPTETVPVAVPNAEGAWRDRKVATNDVPPLLVSGGWGAITGTAMTVGNRLTTWRGLAAAATPALPRRFDIMVPAGGGLTFRASGASAVIPGLVGRIWP